MQDSQLIFMISLPRSGSTMLQKILGAHPSIFTTSEPWLMLHPLHALKSSSIRARYNAKLAERGVRDFLKNVGEDIYYKSLRECYLSLYSAQLDGTAKTYFLDKTPRYFEIYDELRKIFPCAKFIILYRNPAAVLASLLQSWVKDDIDKLKNYKVDLESGVDFLTRNFSQDTNTYCIRYESLVLSPVEEARSLHEFLGIEFIESTLSYGSFQHEQWLFGDQHTVSTKSQPDPAHIDRWQQLLTSPVACALIADYIEMLGSEKVARLGYDFKEITDTLAGAQKLHNHSMLKALKIKQFLTDDADLLYRTKRHLDTLREDVKVLRNKLNLWSTLASPLNTLISSPILRKPHAKINAYKELLDRYQQITRITTEATPQLSQRKLDLALNIDAAEATEIPHFINDAFSSVETASISPNTRDIMPEAVSQPLFTIVTVTHNAEELLQKTIESVAAQNFRNFEYIIIDGGSSDNTVSIIRTNSEHVTDWISERDSGIYDAMNKGISRARGQWINFMNAGDIFSDAYVLEKVACSIAPDSEILYGHRYYLKGGKRTFQESKDIATIFERMPFGHQSTFVKASLLKTVGFNETYKFAADYNLLMMLFCKGHKFQRLDLAICDFLAGGQSESGLRPYLESIKILLDHTQDQKVIAQNAYLNAFRRNNKELFDKACGE